MASRHPAYQQEDDIECLDDLTASSSLPNIQVTEDNTEDENDLWVIGINLYRIKEEQLRYRLHKECLEKDSIEKPLPKDCRLRKELDHLSWSFFFSAQNIHLF